MRPGGVQTWWHENKPRMITRVTTSNRALHDADTFRWDMRVRAEHDSLSSVTMKLHPTFTPDTVELQRHADGTFLSGTFSGWGTFPIQATLTFLSSDGPVRHTVTHPLSFDQPEHTITHDLPLDEPLSNSSDPERNAEHGSAAVRAPDGANVSQRLRETGSLRHGDPRFFHGRAWPQLDEEEAPRATWVSEARPRGDHEGLPAWLNATEWEDRPAVLRRKLELLALLLRASRRTVFYTGAGVSVSAGIGQAAKGSAKKGRSSANAEPTPTHFAAGMLAQHGLAHGWVQQNHDGLPQKAGWPQERINEIHGRHTHTHTHKYKVRVGVCAR